MCGKLATSLTHEWGATRWTAFSDCCLLRSLFICLISFFSYFHSLVFFQNIFFISTGLVFFSLIVLYASQLSGASNILFRILCWVRACVRTSLILWVLNESPLTSTTTTTTTTTREWDRCRFQIASRFRFFFHSHLTTLSVVCLSVKWNSVCVWLGNTMCASWF